MPPIAPFPREELERIAAVQRLRLLGTPSEERFDKLTRLVKRLLNVPIAMIDLVGESRVWFKSVQGMDAVLGERATSYCQYTLLNDELCYIEDSLADPRVLDTPYAQTLRFYAGVPLLSEGQKVGVLCACDYKPRRLSHEDKLALRDIADLAERELSVVKLSEAQLMLAKANEELAQRALIDGLTHVWNRSAIFDLCASELERARQLAVTTSLLMLDVDHFKRINDTYGHAGGDEVLRQLSQRLRAAVRPLDAIGRYGGEEFMLVLPACSHDSAITVAERLRHCIEAAPIMFDGRAIHVTASLGGVVCLRQDATPDALARIADSALYDAKRAGRNRVRIVTH